MSNQHHQSSTGNRNLKLAVDDALNNYFNYLEGEQIGDVHGMVMNEIETILIANVYQRSNRNQSHCAKMLGISRNNLRAKLKKYHII